MIRRIVFALSLGLGLALGLLWLLGSQNSVALADPGILYVAPGGDCGGVTPCYATVQAAVDAANSGNEIRVAASTYSGTQTVVVTVWGNPYTYTQVVIVTESLTLRGGYTTADWTTSNPIANPTIIDAQRQGRGISIVGDGSQTVTLDGFTITGGDYTGLGNSPGQANVVCARTGSDCGGGLFARSVTLVVRNCIITDNIASRTTSYSDGGGMYLWNLSADSRIEATTVLSNSAPSRGTAGGGIAISRGADITISQSTFAGNDATSRGGGLDIFQPWGLVVIERTAFLSNTTAQGGAINTSVTHNGEALRMDRTLLQGNQAYRYGAALSLGKAGGGITRARLTNLVLVGNRTTSNATTGSVVGIGRGYDFFDLTLAHVTASDNLAPTFLRAEAPYSGSALTVTLTNTLVTSATNAFVGYEPTGRGNLLIGHTNTLAHNVGALHFAEEGSPTFQAANTLTGDPKLSTTYHLQVGSAAIDAGVDAGVTTDIDGDARPDGCFFDIGADEYITGVECKRIYLPIVLRRW
jgi:hypothetical protein